METLFCIGYVGLMAFFIFWYRPAKDKELERNKKAIQISKHFGDTKLTLFRFSDSGEHRPTKVWALVEFNYLTQDLSALCRHDNYFVVSDTYMSSQESIQKEDDEVRKILALLPYRIEIWDADITFGEYESKIAKHREFIGREKTYLRKAQYSITGNIKEAKRILEQFDSYDSFEARQDIYNYLNDIELAIKNLKTNTKYYDE